MATGPVRYGVVAVGVVLASAGSITGSSLAPPIRIDASLDGGQLVFTIENTSRKTLALEAMPSLVLFKPDWDSTKSSRYWAPIDLPKGLPMLSQGVVKLKLRPGKPSVYHLPIGEFVWGAEGGSTTWPTAKLRDVVAPGRYLLFLSLGGAGSNRVAVLVDAMGHITAAAP